MWYASNLNTCFIRMNFRNVCSYSFHTCLCNVECIHRLRCTPYGVLLCTTDLVTYLLMNYFCIDVSICPCIHAIRPYICWTNDCRMYDENILHFPWFYIAVLKVKGQKPRSSALMCIRVGVKFATVDKWVTMQCSNF